MAAKEGSDLKTALVILAICGVVGGAVAASMLMAGDPEPAGPHPALIICENALTDVRQALYVYRAERKWDWQDILNESNRNIGEADAPPAKIRSLVKEKYDALAGSDEWHQFLLYEEERRARRLLPAPPFSNREQECLFGFVRPSTGPNGACHVAVYRNNPSPAKDKEDPQHANYDQLFILVTAIAEEAPDDIHQVAALVEYSEVTYALKAGLHARGGAVIEGSVRLEGPLGRALVTEGDLLLHGSPVVAHSACAEGEAILRGEISAPPQGFESRSSNLPPVPDIVPEVYRPQADFVLQADGKVVNQQGTLVADTNIDGPWNGACCPDFQGWEIADGPPLPPGLYFVEGDLRMISFGGRAEEIVTIVATGSVRLEGSLRLRAKTSDTLVLAGADLVVDGTSAMDLHGVLAAREQARVGGAHLTIQGAVMVHDSADLSIAVRREVIGERPVAVWLGGGMKVVTPENVQSMIKAPLHAIQLKWTQRLWPAAETKTAEP